MGIEVHDAAKPNEVDPGDAHDRFQRLPYYHSMNTPVMDENSLEKLRRLCLALPEVTERLSHGEPTWFVRDKKVFVMYANHHHDDRLAFWCAAPPGAQDVLVNAEPEKYFIPPYVGHRGWLGVRLDVPVDWEEIAALVADAYRAIAPRRLLADI
jgi:hypothetical protein